MFSLVSLMSCSSPVTSLMVRVRLLGPEAGGCVTLPPPRTSHACSWWWSLANHSSVSPHAGQ